MKILLINPPRVDGYPVVREERFEHKDIGSIYPPLSLLHTAALLEKEGYEVGLIDANGFNFDLAKVEEEINDFKPDLVIARCAFDTQKDDLQVLKLAKKAGAVTVLRNQIVSRVPKIREQLLLENRFVDVFLNQEPESLVIKLAKTLEEGESLKRVPGISFRQGTKIDTNPDMEKLIDVNQLPLPAYHLLPSLKVYYSGTYGPPFVTVLGSRGCPFNCSFCTYSRTGYRKRDPEKIVEELVWLTKRWGISEFYFWDEVVTLDDERMIEICRLINKNNLKLRWTAALRADGVSYPLLKAMREAGCDEIAIGIESGSEKVLRKTGKGISLNQVRGVAQLCHQLKIKFYAMFVLGLPGETRETVAESIKFAKELKSFYTQFCFATPFPNTRIYQYYKRNGLLLTEDWSHYFPLNEKPVIRTKALTAQELMVLRNQAYRAMLFDWRYLINQVSLTDWKYNWRGLRQITKRLMATALFKPVR